MSEFGRVLVIEDDPGVATVIRYALRKAGADEVVVCEDGTAGLALARQMDPDLVLCDLVLPGMDGTEIAQALREGTPPVEAPVVFVTAAASLAFRDRSPQDYGAAGVITKPVDLGRLAAQLREILAR